MEIKFNSELLRPLEHIADRDPRNGLVKIDASGFSPLDITDYYEAISKINLNKDVPMEIIIQLDTAKNLYLYAWYVYRFYAVAEHHALACLELALRTRYKADIDENKLRSKKPTLRPLLRYSIERGDIKNEHFKKWNEIVRRRAKVRYEREKSDEMRAKGLDQIELNYSEVKINDDDRNWDYVKNLLDFLPDLRNEYAHGTSMLLNRALERITVVSEIINQIYPVKE